MLNPSKQITKWRKKAYILLKQDEIHGRHASVIGDYSSNLSTTFDIPDLPSAELIIHGNQWDPQIAEQLKQMFVVPKPNKFHQTQNQIGKCQLLQAFLSFLVQLLYHKTDPVDNRVRILETDLRSLLTVLVDVSWMLVDHEFEFENLLVEFEAGANQAGFLVHSLLFSSTDVAVEEIEDGIAFARVLNHTDDLLKSTLQLFDITTPVYTNPRTSMVNSFVIIGSLVDDLEDLLKREDNRIADVKAQVNLLYQELMLLQSSINNIRLQRPSEIGEFKEHLMFIGRMAYQAEYLITSFLVKHAPLWYVINRLNYLIHEIELKRIELQVVTEKYKVGGLRVTESLIPHRREAEGSSVMVGFEDEAMDILGHLVGGGRESLQVISILGMPGLGKTTLAKKLYNHPLVSDWFDKLSWCVVSQTYERHSILADILIHINSDLGEDKIFKMEEETLVEHIYKTLKGRRYLIVMDDIWDSNVWDELFRCYPDDGNGSKILLTSRNKDVAPPNSLIYRLPLLSDEQCWEILGKKVFGSRNCPPELHPIGKKIAAKCCGLPLTAVVIAGILSTMDEEVSAWEEVGGSLASYIDGEENSVMQILELSYKHLPDHLKPCFLYFGAFKEDQKIMVGNLKKLWIAEGFIRTQKDKRREDIAEEYLMELVDKNLVMVAQSRSSGRGVKACVVHDLLRDLCLRKCEEEGFLKYSNSYKHIIFEKGHRIRALANSTTLSLCQRVRSFHGDHQTSPLYVGDMTLLRVLHFSYIGHGRFFEIDSLVNLRYLVIGELPPLIENLLNLEYLRVTSSKTLHIPSAISKLNKLRCLHAFQPQYGEDWNDCRTNSLECLSWLNIKRLKDEELLKCSPHLRKLKCRYTITLPSRSKNPHFDLCFLTQLHSLSLTYIANEGLKLEKFGFPSNIRKLRLSGTRLRWEKMSILGRMENLEVLNLRRRASEGDRWDTREGEFQKLRLLTLEQVSLSRWIVASSQHFPKLQQLIMISCVNLQEIPSEIGEITTLEMIVLKSRCPKSLTQSAERIKQEQLDMGNEVLRVIHHL